MEINPIRYGNIYREDFSTGYAGNVWSAESICPTLTTAQGGSRTPLVMDINVVGKLNENSNQRNVVYDTENIAPTIQAACGTGGGNTPLVTEINEVCIGSLQQHSAIKTDGICTSLTAAMGMGGGQIPMVTETKQIVAMRGRDPQNPNDRTPGNPNLEQRLEVNSEGICNCLTTVQKDNMVLHIKQATKKGYTECEVGGDLRHVIPRKHNEKRKSNRQRKHMSNSDNNEYP